MTTTSEPAIQYRMGNEKLICITDPASRKLRGLLERQGRLQERCAWP